MKIIIKLSEILMIETENGNYNFHWIHACYLTQLMY